MPLATSSRLFNFSWTVRYPILWFCLRIYVKIMLKSITIFLFVLAISATTGVVVTWYSDAKCTSKGGLPGLISNPMTFRIGECVQMLENGFSAEAQSCDASAAVTITYPFGCGNSTASAKQQVQPNTCASADGESPYFFVEC